MKIDQIDTYMQEGILAYEELSKTDSPLFKAVEAKFDQWIKESNPASEYDEKYFGDGAIASKKGAIREGIDMIFDVMTEEELTTIDINDKRLDWDAVFAC